MHLDEQKTIKLSHFRTQAGRTALATLCELLHEEHIKFCLRGEGAELHRTQGKLLLIEWLKQLPKGLDDAANGSATERLG